jgi:hypothetical protein
VAAVQFIKKPILVIPKPALSARNLLAAGSETADSSRDDTALRNDNSVGVFQLHNYKISESVPFSAIIFHYSWTLIS